MTDYLQKVENLAVLALLGVLAYLGLKWTGTFDGKKEESETADLNPCAGMAGLPAILCNVGVWTVGAQDKPESADSDLKGSIPGTVIGCDSDDILCALFDDRTKTGFDTHGCATAYQEFCEYFNTCIPKGSSCPGGSKPYTPVYEMDEHGCKKGVETFCDVLDKCLNNEVFSSSFCNIEDGRGESPTRQINDQCYFRGLPVLNVPPGTDCSSAMSVMCDRFGPGVHQGKDWCLMAGD